jgi:Zn-dependent protease
LNLRRSDRDGSIVFTVSWRDYILIVRANPYLWLALTAVLSWLLFVPLLGWTIATVLIVSVFIHELGHAAVGSRLGLKNVSIHFIPLFGACTIANSGFTTSRDRGAMTLAGPLAGLASAWIAYALYASIGWEPLLVYVVWTLLLTISNLIPMMPFDGGHVTSSLLAPAKVRSVRVIQTIGLVASFAGLAALGLPLIVVVPLLLMALAIAFRELHKIEDAERVCEALTRLFGLPAGDLTGVMGGIRGPADRQSVLQTASAARKKHRRWWVGRLTHATDDCWFESRTNLAFWLSFMVQRSMPARDKVWLWAAYLLTVGLAVLLGIYALGTDAVLIEFARVAFMLQNI